MSAAFSRLQRTQPVLRRCLAASSAPLAGGARRCYSAAPFFANEPAAPVIKTEFPGPKSKEALADIDAVFDTNNVNMVTDFGSSVGNYIADPDGNLRLDVYAQIASIAIGYNNPALLAAAASPAMQSALANRPALGNFPQHDWGTILRESLLLAAPTGLDKVFTATTGSDANETAYKAAFMYVLQKERAARGEPEFTADELATSMENKSPGCPARSILSFRKGFHGRLFGSLTTTRSKPIHKLDIPAFDWPAAPFPELKYPLADFAAENAAEEARCLAEVERLITGFPQAPVAVVVEPIQSEGGDNHASPAFFCGLRALTAKHGVLFIVDEVQTGVGATGRMWAHDHWNLPTPPDMVTFSKKAQAAGYFYADPALRPAKPYRQFNTWMGDPVRALLFKAMIKEITDKKLIENTAATGAHLYAGIAGLAAKYQGQIVNLRGEGRGTFIAFDSPKRDALLRQAKDLGLNIGGCGDHTVRLRPMLVFQKAHADILLEILEKLVKA